MVLQRYEKSLRLARKGGVYFKDILSRMFVNWHSDLIRQFVGWACAFWKQCHDSWRWFSRCNQTPDSGMRFPFSSTARRWPVPIVLALSLEAVSRFVTVPPVVVTRHLIQVWGPLFINRETVPVVQLFLFSLRNNWKNIKSHISWIIFLELITYFANFADDKGRDFLLWKTAKLLIL